jgi:hypothetical protein
MVGEPGGLGDRELVEHEEGVEVPELMPAKWGKSTPRSAAAEIGGCVIDD